MLGKEEKNSSAPSDNEHQLDTKKNIIDYDINTDTKMFKTDNACLNTLDKQDTLIKLLHREFPLHNLPCHFKDFYPFCNEFGYAEIIKHLKETVINTTKIKVALLFGESNFLSLLPFLKGICDVILLADIQPKMYKHIKFLLQCFEQSDSPEAFISCYLKDNPILDESCPAGNKYDIHLLKEMLSGSESLSRSLGKYYFLYNQKSYDQCKQALVKCKIVQINLDLINDNACNKLASLLSESDAILTLCNFTNIHHYVDPGKLSISTHSLLKNNLDNCMIMFSCGPLKTLRALCTIGLAHYLATPKNEILHVLQGMSQLKQMFEVQKTSFSDLYRRNSLFIQNTRIKNTTKIPEHCYVGFHIEYSSLDKNDIQKYLNGKYNLIEFSTDLHAFNTEKEAEYFILERFFEQRTTSLPENTYWIFTVSGNKEKINPLLRCVDNYNQWLHFPIDNLEAGLKFNSRIIKAINNTRTITIENDDNREYREVLRSS